MKGTKEKKSKVITFYSFKGGVGRSMALVNVATLLSSWGFNVLMIDWDLEAPGLENFFTPYTTDLDISNQAGLLDLLDDLQQGKTVQWQDYIYRFSTKISTVPLQIMTSGRAKSDYTERLRAFDLEQFYREQDGGNRLEALRKEWLNHFDFVLIDSRTGVTDFGGICTIQMPDILVMLLTPTEQGLNGTIRIAQRADEARRSLPFDREKLLVFPVPSRIDSTTEFEQSRKWIDKFAEKFHVFFNDWLPTDVARTDFLQRIKLPYIAYFSYGENLPVIEQGMSDTAGLGYAYENLSMLLGHALDRVDLFWKDRPQYSIELTGTDYPQYSSPGNTEVEASKLRVMVIGSEKKMVNSVLTGILKNMVPVKINISPCILPIAMVGLTKEQNNKAFDTYFTKSISTFKADVYIVIIDKEIINHLGRVTDFVNVAMDDTSIIVNVMANEEYEILDYDEILSFLLGREIVLFSDIKKILPRIIPTLQYAYEQKLSTGIAAPSWSAPENG